MQSGFEGSGVRVEKTPRLQVESTIEETLREMRENHEAFPVYNYEEIVERILGDEASLSELTQEDVDKINSETVREAAHEILVERLAEDISHTLDGNLPVGVGLKAIAEKLLELRDGSRPSLIRKDELDAAIAALS